MTTRFDELGETYAMTPDGSQYLWDEDGVVTWHDTVTNQQIDFTELPSIGDTTSGPFGAKASPNGELVAFQEFDLSADFGDYRRLLGIVDRAGNDAVGDDDDPETTAAISGTTASLDGYVWSDQGDLYFGALSPEDETPQLVRLDADLETFEPIIDFPSFDVLPSDLAVSPDGTQLVYTYMQRLYRLDVATGEQVQLTTSSTRETDATFSPDGRHIAFKLPDGSTGSGFGTAYVIPNGDYPEPVRIQQADSPEDVPADAPYDVLFDDEGRGLIIDTDIYWFPTP